MNNKTNANDATFDPYLTWLGIRDPQRPPNHYRLLGLELFENDPEVIAAAADRQMTYVRTYQAGQQGEHSQRILNELTTAKLCLLKPERKRDYDYRLQAAQKPAPLPPQQPPQVQPMAATLPPRQVPTAYVQQTPYANQVGGYQGEQARYGASPVSGRGTSARPAQKNLVLQWSIVGGLVLATVILAVVLANNSRSPEPAPVANNPTSPKTKPINAKNPKSAPNTAAPAEPKFTTQPVNQTTKPQPSEVKDPEKDRPGPVKAPLPNVPLPGIEEPQPGQTNPVEPKPAQPNTVNPMGNPPPQAPANPATTPPANTTPPTVATNDPLNSLPTSVGNPAPAPMPMGNPLNPPTEPANPLAMPNPMNTNPPTGGMPQPAAPRRPVPNSKEIAESRTNVYEVLKADFASRDATVISALGRQLLQMARDSKDKPAMMYVTYEEARNVSARVNDLETTFAAHEDLVREFAIDRDKDLLETLKVVAKNAMTMNPDTAGLVLDIIYESVQAAIVDQRLDFAEQILRYVSNFSPRVPDRVAREVGFRDLVKKVSEHKAFAIRSKEYKETLTKNPNDGDANLELGKFWAFQQNNFEKGNPYLAKGSDTEIREAAQRELTIKPDSPELVKVADAWWEAGNKLPPEPRATIKIHSAYLYAQALPSLKALERGIAETRISEAYKLFKPNNPEVKELIKLLLTRTNWKMEWKSRPLEPVLTFKPSGELNSYEYPTWKLFDNYFVVCFRERSFADRFGNAFANRFGRGGPPGRRNDNNDDDAAKPMDATRNVMQIAVLPKRIEIRVLNEEGKLRNEGVGIPE